MSKTFGRRGNETPQRSSAPGAEDQPPGDRVVSISGADAAGAAPGANLPTSPAILQQIEAATEAMARERLGAIELRGMPRRQVAQQLDEMVAAIFEKSGVESGMLDRRTIVTSILGRLCPATSTVSDQPVGKVDPVQPPAPAVPPMPATPAEGEAAADQGSRPARDKEKEKGKGKEKETTAASASRASVEGAKSKVQDKLMERIDMSAAAELTRDELAQQIGEVIQEILADQKIQLNLAEQRDLITLLLNDMLGLGPLEPLLADEAITDILVNGPNQVYIERGGKLELTDIVFRDNQHVMNIATRIVSRVGRRVDEQSPLCDARLMDGSRVNIIAPPLAIDGPSISIRKFSKKKITLDTYERQNNMSPEMATVLRIAGRARCNVLISGGTGSGKTTLLNAMSQMIDPGERIVTIEDAAELQLQQPHVVRLETRPPNLENTGEITMRDLVKNALRMRPDRIILGEVRGSEALDMLQAMNTGHEGSMGTIHANSPRESLTRLENMIGMAGINLLPRAVRTQVCDALDLIVQVSRMRDGVRRIVSITEVVGMEGDIITTQELFSYQFEGEDSAGRLVGTYVGSNLRPFFAPKAEYFGLGQALMEAI